MNIHASKYSITAFLWLVFFTFASSLVLPISNISSISDLATSINTLSLLDLAGNSTALVGNGDDPVCNGQFFGYNLRVSSCFQVLSSIKADKTRQSFGPRGHVPFNVQLPRRFSSSDGTCVIEISNRAGTVGDIASQSEILHASMDIYTSCISKPRQNTGGMVRGLGQFGSLLVAIRLYKPSVTCTGKDSTRSDVGQNLIDEIPTDTTQQVFGPTNQYEVDVFIPNTIKPNPSSLPPYDWQAQVNSLNGEKVVGRWYELWSGAVAINAMCVKSKRGRSGQALYQGGLTITLEHASAALNSDSTALYR